MKKEEIIKLLEPYEDDAEIMIDIPECSTYKDIVGIRPGGVYAHFVTEHIEAEYKLTIK